MEYVVIFVCVNAVANSVMLHIYWPTNALNCIKLKG